MIIEWDEDTDNFLLLGFEYANSEDENQRGNVTAGEVILSSDDDSKPIAYPVKY